MRSEQVVKKEVMETESPQALLAQAHYRWLPALVVVNLVGLGFAILGGVGPSSLLSFAFPQIWGWGNGFGAMIGTFTVLTLVVSALVNAAGGVSARDCWYRFFAGITLASAIMFAFFPVALIALTVVVGVIGAWPT